MALDPWVIKGHCLRTPWERCAVDGSQIRKAHQLRLVSASYYLQGFSTIPGGDRWILAINRYVYDKLLLLCHLHESRKTLEENFGNNHGWWARKDPVINWVKWRN